MPEEEVVVKKIDHRRRTMRLLEEQFERERIRNELNYANLKAFAQIQDERIANQEVLNEMLLRRLEKFELEAKVNPLKKLLKHYSLFM